MVDAKEVERLTGILRGLAGEYIRPCSGCDKPTWWRVNGSSVPICTACTIKTDRHAVNVVPRALCEFLPPYEATP